MSILVTDTGFRKDDWTQNFTPAGSLAANDTDARISVDLTSDADLEELSHRLTMIDMIRIDFPSFGDGRGFTIARRLRLLGYNGRLRASGHVIADQYAMARRSGFDEVEISDELAKRQPEEQWLARANWTEHDYQSRLRA